LVIAAGAAALVLATAGLYGVLALGVRQRSREIGVRMALGATVGHVVRMVLWQGTWRVALGVALGLVPAWWLTHMIGPIAFNVSADDPLVFAVAVAALLAAGLTASLVPAVRAASVDPLVALRKD
jgi:ABC-type antimicrobial peptide transport system permease subunit